MQYGVCEWIFGGQDLKTTASFLQKAEFDGLELIGDLERYTPEMVNRIMAEAGLAVLSLTTVDVDLASHVNSIRAAAVDYYYHLIDFAAEVGFPVVTCHGLVGRIRPLSSLEEEYHWLVNGVRTIGERARRTGIRVAIEVLNRYESHLLNTACQALVFLTEAGNENVGLLLDAYHMNIEESDPIAALQAAGDRLFLYHAADSNRQAVGRGHTAFRSQFQALNEFGYHGSVIFECSACGPDPFTPVKGPGWEEQVKAFVRESLDQFRLFEQELGQ